MTGQQRDQAALDGLVDDCYPDGWPWREHDVWIDTIGTVGHVHHPDYYNSGKGDRYRLYAGTWVEGRLIELMGEAFRGLYNYGGEWMCEYFIKEALLECSEGCPTPITALVAALRVLKQKEVDGDL